MKKDKRVLAAAVDRSPRRQTYSKMGSLILMMAFVLLFVRCASDELSGLTTRDTDATDAAALANEEKIAEAKKAAQLAEARGLAENIGRSLASTDGKLEQSFTKLMNSPQASDYINQELNRIQVLHALSDGYLRAFDELLDKAVQNPKPSIEARFLENEPYAQLLAVHRLLDETETRIDYFLYRALETKWSEDVRPEHKQAAVQLVEHFNYNLQRREEYYAQPAVQEIAYGFEVAADQARASYLAEYPNSPPEGLARDLAQTIRLVSAQAHAVSKQAQVAPTHTPKPLSAEITKQVSKEIAGLVQEIRETWKDQAEESAEADGKIHPSSGIDGTLDGSKFRDSTWAVTFEEGPSIHDDSILRELSTRHMRATFFWTAQNVVEQKDRVKAAEALGMNLGNRSFTGFDLGRADATPERIQHEVADAVSIESQAYGYRPKIYRCPYGSCLQVDSVREALEAQSLVHVQWNVDGLDWKDHGVDSVHERIKKEMKLQKRGIIVLRESHPESALVTAQVLQDLEQEATRDPATRVVTIQDAIDENNRK